MDFQAPLPPPPPPPSMNRMHSNTMVSHPHQHPSALNLNNNQIISDRSQLLLDIERGTTLKKVAHSQKGLNSRAFNQLNKQVSLSVYTNNFSFKIILRMIMYSNTKNSRRSNAILI